MKTTFIALLALCLCLVGCGKEVTPDQAANKLLVEAIELINLAKPKELSDYPAAIKAYEEALGKARKIVSDYKESDIAVKVVSGESVFAGESMAQIEKRLYFVQARASSDEEGKRQKKRLAEKEKRRVDAERKAREKHLIWWFETGGPVSSSPAIGPDGTVYVGSVDKKLYAINGKSGDKLWEFETGGPVWSSPAIGSDGTVYVGSTDKKLYAIRTKSGVKLWEFETGNTVRSSPAIGSDGTVYVGSEDTKVYALDGRTGAKKWEFFTRMPDGRTLYGDCRSSPAIGSDGTVYIGKGRSIYALDGKTGAKKWDFVTWVDVKSSPAIGSDGTVYVGSDYLYALDGKTGRRKWSFKPKGRAYGIRWVRSSPAIGSDGTVFFGAGTHDFKQIYALDGKTGGIKWELKTGNGVDSSPAIGSDGTVYVGSDDHYLFAIKTDSKGLAKSPWPMRGQNARHTGRVMKKN